MPHIHIIFISNLVSHILGSQVGTVPLHSPLSWQDLELSPTSAYPELQVYAEVEARVLPDCITWPFLGLVRLVQYTTE